uniref:uncharacterized protein LOC122602340 n=1 Tax=Erigeron canadensis TaxID=72917 RepID=UPI001CB8EC16|nr:uncharacterized protein LOC122602340 [Erigeron canadensis]
MGILSFIVSILTITYGNTTLFIVTSFILFFSAFLFLINSKNRVQVFKQQFSQENKLDHLIESDKGCLDMGLQDSCSESEVIDQFSCTTEEEQDSDYDRWQFSGDTSGRRTECSDGSISDEESLIEIELPGGHYVGHNEYKHEEENKFYCRKRSPESVLWWREMNEEENMIEIDLSVGSIKCSRFGIKA